MIFGFLLSLLSIASSSNFDWTTGNTTVGLSSNMYCDTSTYLTMDYSINPYTDSFVPTYQIYNAVYDVNGVIGYRPADKTIYVVFRGTQSTRDWIDDLRFEKIDYF